MQTSAKVLLLIMIALGAACSPSSERRGPPVPENSPPEIFAITVDPPRIHRGVRGRVKGEVQDADRDFIVYRWSATRGTFPLGDRLPLVDYIAPLTGRADTLTLLAADAEDTTIMSREVVLANLAPPTNLNVVPGPNWVEVSWTASVDRRLYDFSGYQVFASERSFVGLSEEELQQLLVTPVPSPSTMFLVQNLQQETIYYFQVRAVRGIGERSPRTAEEDTAPRPQGTEPRMLEFANPENNPEGPRGFDLSVGSQVELNPESPINVDAVDFYLGTTDPEDGSGELRVKSPEHLAARNPIWSQRRVGFKSLGKDWGVGSSDTTGFSSSVSIADSAVVAVRLPEGQFAKIQVTEVRNSHPFRQIQFRWAYQKIPGYAKF